MGRRPRGRLVAHGSIGRWQERSLLRDYAFEIGVWMILSRSLRCLPSRRCGTSRFGVGFRVRRLRPFFFAGSRSKNPAAGPRRLQKIEGRADLIGYIGLTEPNFLPEVMPSVEIGWRLDPLAWGRGLATEGAKAALAFGFEDLHLEGVVSICEPDNVSSSRVMERLGMHFDRETVDPERGVPLSLYRLERAEWETAG